MRRDDGRNRETVTVQACIERDRRTTGNSTAFTAKHEAAQRDAEARTQRQLTVRHRDVRRVCVRESIRCRRSRACNGICTTSIEPIRRRSIPGAGAAGADGGPIDIPEDVGGAGLGGRTDAEEDRGDHEGRAGNNSTRTLPSWHEKIGWGIAGDNDLIPSSFPLLSFQQ